MPGSKNQDRSDNMGAHEKLKWETAKELGLDDDLTNAGDQLTVREAGKIGGNMVKKLIQAGNDALKEVQSHLNQTDR